MKNYGYLFELNKGAMITLYDNLKELINNEMIKNHVTDIIAFRVKIYYKNIFFKNKK